MPRILLVADLSERTREALSDATRLHRRWGTLIDAYYLWASADDVPADSPERTVRELEAFSREECAWEVLDELGAADRAGVVVIRGYLTMAGSGLTLSEHAIARGYLGILYGTATPPPATQRYELHGAPPECPPEAANVIARRDRMRSHAR